MHRHERERRSLVSTLVRSFGLQPPVPEIGEVVNVLANAGVFRLRGVLVGIAGEAGFIGNAPVNNLQTVWFAAGRACAILA
jgi:hypothetical protein